MTLKDSKVERWAKNEVKAICGKPFNDEHRERILDTILAASCCEKYACDLSLHFNDGNNIYHFVFVLMSVVEMDNNVEMIKFVYAMVENKWNKNEKKFNKMLGIEDANTG